MSQTFEYPNLLTGSRSGAGWLYDNGGMRLERSDLNHKQHALLNSKKHENFIRSPLVSLKHGIVYEFSVYTANGSNCAGSDIFVLYEKTVDGWIARSITKCAKGPGGDGSLLHSQSQMPLRKATTSSDSTTMAQRMGKMYSFGSTARCCALLQNRMHGLRQKGRCGCE